MTASFAAAKATVSRYYAHTCFMNTLVLYTHLLDAVTHTHSCYTPCRNGMNDYDKIVCKECACNCLRAYNHLRICRSDELQRLSLHVLQRPGVFGECAQDKSFKVYIVCLYVYDTSLEYIYIYIYIHTHTHTQWNVCTHT